MKEWSVSEPKFEIWLCAMQLHFCDTRSALSLYNFVTIKLLNSPKINFWKVMRCLINDREHVSIMGKVNATDSKEGTGQCMS